MVRLQRLCRPRQNSLSIRHPQMGAACFARTILKVFKFSHSLSPTLRLLFSRKAAAMAILSESGKSISSEICQSLFLFFNISCPPQFLLLSLLLQDQQKQPPSLLPWKKDAKAHHPSSPPEHIKQTKLLLVSYSRNHEYSAFV